MEDTKFKIETADAREVELFLKSKIMANVLYDLLCWKRSIYNGKNYGEGSVIYKGKIYKKHEYEILEHSKDEYDETEHFLKEQPLYVYTEDEIEDKLEYYLEDISDFIYRYME